MPSTTRTFLALALPPALERPLTRLQEQLTPEAPGVRWVATLPFHLTLAFLGDVPDVDLNAVCKAVEEAARPFPPLELRLQGVGAFPNPARPRVVWAGLEAASPALLQDLQKAVVRAATSTGYRPDDSRFTPHVTLGRVKFDRRTGKTPPPDLTRLVETSHNWSGGSFTAREVTTFASSLTPEGPVYAPLARALLAGKKAAETP